MKTIILRSPEPGRARGMKELTKYIVTSRPVGAAARGTRITAAIAALTLLNAPLAGSAWGSPAAAGDSGRVGASTATNSPVRRPNVLFITVDDLSDAPRFMGRNLDARTPNLDTLAASGTAFRRAHCSYPLCGPSRASFLSGLNPTTLGFQNHMNPTQLKARTDALGATLLHSHFKQHGYKTFSAGKVYHDGHPTHDIDQTGGSAAFGAVQNLNYSAPGTSTDWGVPANYTNDTVLSDYHNAQWAIARLNETHEQPFLLMVGFVQPHVPWYAPQPWFDLYPNKYALTLEPFLASDFDDIPAEAQRLSLQPQYPRTTWAITNNQRENIQQAYLACVSFTDHYIGQVLTALSNSPYATNTIIVVLSDNGYHLGSKNTHQKETLWDRSSRVPLIFAGPGVAAGQVCERVVSLLDVYPTLIDLCGLPENPMLEGASLRPLLENAQAPWERPALISFLGNNHAVQGERYRYIRWNDGSEELYDLETDPHEHVNLAGNPALASVKSELRKWLPTNLKSPRFRMHFEPNRGTASAYLSEMLARGDVSIYDQPVGNTTAVVEGMRLRTTISNTWITLELVPATPFGTWRQNQFDMRQLRDLSVSGSLGRREGNRYSNLAEYALGLNTRLASGASFLGFVALGGLLFPKLSFHQYASRTDVDISLETASDVTSSMWTVIARSLAGATTAATNGATVWQTGSEPRLVDVLAPGSVADNPIAFFRAGIAPVGWYSVGSGGRPPDGGCTTAPSAPTNVVAVAGSGSVMLSWSYDRCANSFILFRNNQAIAAGVTGSSYTDTGVSSGISYCYRVRAVNMNGLSPLSETACAEPLP